MWKPLIFLGAVNIPCLHPWSLKLITVLKELNHSISQPSISKQVAHIQFCHFSAKLRGLHWFFIHTAACSFLRGEHGYIQHSLRNRIEVTQLQVIQIFFLKIQKIHLRTKWAYFSFPGSKFQGVLETNFNNTITSKLADSDLQKQTALHDLPSWTEREHAQNTGKLENADECVSPDCFLL